MDQVNNFEALKATIFNFKWLSVKYFTKGWDYFIEQDGQMLLILWTIMVVLDFLLGNGLSCMMNHWVIILFTRRYLAGGLCLSNKRVDGQTIVITGCNVGIGKETARELSRRGAKIIMACRDTKKAEKAAAEIKNETHGEIEVMKLDLASLESIKAFSEDLKAKVTKIHMLINNAGIMMCPYMKTEDGFEMQIGTNHLGHFYLTNLLLPLLKHSEAARIINVSSLGHAGGIIRFDDMAYKKNYSKLFAYCNSKAANILFTRQLGKILKDTNIQVFAVHPGAVKSDLARHISGRLSTMMFQVLQKTTSEGIQTTIHCALEAEQDNEHFYFADCEVSYATEYTRNDGNAQRLWDLSEKMVGLKKD